VSRFNRPGGMRHGVSLGVAVESSQGRSSSLNEEPETAAGRAISSVWGIALMDVQVYDSCALSEARRYIVWPRIFRCNAVSNGHLGEGPFCERPSVKRISGALRVAGKAYRPPTSHDRTSNHRLDNRGLLGGQCFHEAGSISLDP
jgi:hypothetical protein